MYSSYCSKTDTKFLKKWQKITKWHATIEIYHNVSLQICAFTHTNPVLLTSDRMLPAEMDVSDHRRATL